LIASRQEQAFNRQFYNIKTFNGATNRERLIEVIKSFNEPFTSIEVVERFKDVFGPKRVPTTFSVHCAVLKLGNYKVEPLKVRGPTWGSHRTINLYSKAVE
jgi:hypothetical protein